MRTIQVFEHDKLRLRERGFLQRHFDALLRFNELHGRELVQVGYQQVVFRQFVGVIQLEDLCIEVLPKAERQGVAGLWRNALLEMLDTCGYLRLYVGDQSRQSVTRASLIELFFESYLMALQGLIRQGLTKQYYKREENTGAWKGKLVSTTHFRQNIIHQERFYVSHDVYGTDHLLHQILKQAAQVIYSTSPHPHLRSQCNALLLDLEAVQSGPIQPQDFQRIQFGRKTERYRYALQLAQFILQHYSPNLQTGRTEALGILFDMNRLFEEYVYRILRQAAIPKGILVQNQNAMPFWQGQTIRPDLLITYPDGEKVIVDTKWKELPTLQPSSADLRQIFAYNLQFDTRKGVLLYPKTARSSGLQAPFRKDAGRFHDHACQLLGVVFFDGEGRRVREVGERLLELLK